jgi:hypothetical protein
MQEMMIHIACAAQGRRVNISTQPDWIFLA